MAAGGRTSLGGSRIVRPRRQIPPNPERCLLSELQVTLGQESGATDSVGFPVVFTDNSRAYAQ